MSQLFSGYFYTAQEANGFTVSGAKLWFSLTGTTTLAAVYADEDLSTPLTNPVEADSAGRFPAIWLDPAVTYRVRLSDADDNFITKGDIDPINALVTADEITSDSSELAAITSKLLYASPLSGSIPRSITSKLSDFVSVKDFGATGDGSTDDTAAIEAAFDASPWVVFPPGQYNVSSNILLPTTGRMVGLVPQSQQNGNDNEVSIYGTVADFGSGNPIFSFSPAASSSQSFVVENMQVRGDLSVSVGSLSSMSSSGVVGFDVSSAKNGIDFVQSCLRNLQHGIDHLTASPYLDKVTLDRTHIMQCYRAIRANPTAGISGTNLYIFDCFDWIDSTSYVSLLNSELNNSSFSSEDCAVAGTVIEAVGTWTEGGNNVFQPSVGVRLSGGYFSETFSASGTTKFLIKPQGDNVSIDLSGIRVPTNTRLINLTNVTANELVAMRAFGIYGGTNFSSTADIKTALLGGLNYEGWGNTNSSDWNITQRNAGLLLGRYEDTQSGTFSAFFRPRRFQVATNGTFTISCPADLVANGTTNVRHEFVKIQLLGDDDGAGGASAFEATLTVHKGFGTVWEYNLTGTDTTAWTVALSSASATSVQVQITENHSGNGNNDTFCVFAASENVRITF